MRAPFEAVLFDLFDTLCHLDAELYLEGKRRSARTLGVDPERYFQAWLSLQDPCQVGTLNGLEARIRESCALLGRGITARELDEIRGIEEAALRRSARLHPDVVPTLASIRARADLKLALVSNASSPARELTRRLGLDSFFDTLVFSFEVGSLKPQAPIYLAACRRLSVSPSGCLFVGDGNDRELEGAIELGMTAIRIERPGAMEHYRRRPSTRWNHSVRDLAEICRLLEDRQFSAGQSVS
jgi:putative hydrolase of the HAD superfamily